MEFGLEINDLCVDFGRFRIDNLNLKIRKGCITGLIGRNGAGKSTLIKMIPRQQDADSGLILYNGKKFSENEVEILNNVACVFDSPHFNVAAKPKKILKLYQNMYKKFDTERYYALMEKFRLPSDKRLSKFSFGMLISGFIKRQKNRNIFMFSLAGAVVISGLLMGLPYALSTDEVLKVVSPFVENCYEAMALPWLCIAAWAAIAAFALGTAIYMGIKSYDPKKY